MKIRSLVLLPLLFLSLSLFGQSSSVRLGRLIYRGGGDWYVNPTSLPNLISFCNKNMGTNIAGTEDVDVSSPNLFNYPYIHMTGHGNVIFNADEIQNLRNYLLGGGFLHIDDNYGMDIFIRPEIKKIFPEYELVEVPFSHPIFHQKYRFPNGLPKIHEHDGKAPQAFAIINEGRIILLYTYECDLGDGWENQSVHNDPEDVRLKALQMGANIISYCFLSGNE